MGICFSTEHHQELESKSLTKSPGYNTHTSPPRKQDYRLSPVNKSAGRQSPVNKSAARQSPVNKSTGRQSPVNKSTGRQSPVIRPASSIPLAHKNVSDLRENHSYTNVDIFTYEEMCLATKNFRPNFILGEGGFGVVYKGVIDGSVKPGYQTTNVAIKVLDRDGVQGDREWLAEINYLGQFNDPTLVKLIGYCCEDDHRLLVYEYMSGGSLETHLFCIGVSGVLSWSKRMKISLDAAKGLAVLHAAERPIIYRDFKTSNILLDENFNAKLSDFGLAKEGPMGDQTHVSTRVMGTYGYAAPEYVMTGHLTARSDVYGFGVVLLELLLGKRALDRSRPSREHNLVEWARPLLNYNKKVLRIFDPRMDGQYSVKTAMKVANLAYLCLSQNPKGRPQMSQVVEFLETFQTPEDNHEELMIQSGTGSVTLYEAPNHAPCTPRAKKKKPSNREGGEVVGRSKVANGRTKNAPSKESDLYAPPNIESEELD